MNILIRDAAIITADEGKNYIEKGSIGIKDNIIEFVEPADKSVSGFNADKVIDGKNSLVMPGLVNTHTHCAMTVLRNFANDLALEEWLFNKIFPAEARLTPEDIYCGTLHGIAEMIKSGTTTFADMYLQMDEVARAVAETGIRANLSKSPLAFNVGEKRETIDETTECFKYHKNWNNWGNGRIKVFIEVHSAYLFDENTLRSSAQIAKELNTGIQIHLLETLKERKESILRYGKNSAEVCLECGIFDVPVIAAHCVHLSDSDIEILKSKDVSVAHNPTSNLKLGSGIASVPRMLERGINVSLGTDGAASNNNLDMFEEMNLAALIHKGVSMNPEVVSARQAIRMATVNGSKAAGFGSEVGPIKKGMKADLIILNIDKPHLYPLNDPESAIVYAAQGADVETVIVDGNILMENRQLTTIDEEKVKYKVREISTRIIKGS
jgi:5-methylthioadenosine/S-adenosylhomocysteine deaminase